MARKKSPPRQLAEERFAFSGGVVDRTDPERPIIKGALLCGPVSGNTFIGEGRERTTVSGRRYLAKAFAGDRVQKYADRPVFLNHPAKPTDHRQYQDKIAVVKNPRHRADGMPVGDLAVNPKHPHAEQFLWDAEHDPNSCGMSHRAWCKWETSADNYADAVELEEVLSVDLVVGSATTKGVFEHMEQAVKKIKIVEVSEWVAKHPKSTSLQCIRMKQLAEEAGDAEMDAPEDGAEPGGAIDEAFKALMHAHMDEMIDGSTTVEDFVKKVKAMHKAHKGPDKKDDSEDGGEKKEPKEEKAKEESKAIGFDKALTLCAEMKYAATPNEYRLLAKCDSEAEVKSFVQEQAGKTEQKPRSSGRTVTNPPKEPVQETRAIPAWDRMASKN